MKGLDGRNTDIVGTAIYDIMLQYRHPAVRDLQQRVLNDSASITPRTKNPFSQLIEQAVDPLAVKAYWNKPEVTVAGGQVELTAEVSGGARQFATERILTLNGAVSVRANPIFAVDTQERPYACIDLPDPQSLNMRKFKVTYEGSRSPKVLAVVNPAKAEAFLRPTITTQLFGRLTRVPLTYMPTSLPIAMSTKQPTPTRTLPIVRALPGILDKPGSVALALMLNERYIPSSTVASLLPDNSPYNAAIGISTVGLNTLLEDLCQQGQAVGQFHHSRLGQIHWQWLTLTVTLLKRTIRIEGALLQQGIRTWVQAEVGCWLDDNGMVRVRWLSGNTDALVGETVLTSWISLLNALLCAPAARKENKDTRGGERLTQHFDIPTTTQTVEAVAQELLVMDGQLIIYYTIPMSLKTLPLEIAPPKPTVTLVQPRVPHQSYKGALVMTKVEARITQASVAPYDYAWTTDLSPDPNPERSSNLTIHAVPPLVLTGGRQQLTTARLRLIDMFGQVSEVQAPLHYIASARTEQAALVSSKRRNSGSVSCRNCGNIASRLWRGCLTCQAWSSSRVPPFLSWRQSQQLWKFRSPLSGE